MFKRTFLSIILLASFSSSYAMKTDTRLVMHNNDSMAVKVIKAVVKIIKHRNKEARKKEMVKHMVEVFKGCTIL